MEELKESVKKLVGEELERANKKFPAFHSAHEGYAIIKEEVEEAAAELNEIKTFLEFLWFDVKDNRKGKHEAEALKELALNLAAESIQVSAMSIKFIKSFENSEV